MLQLGQGAKQPPGRRVVEVLDEALRLLADLGWVDPRAGRGVGAGIGVGGRLGEGFRRCAVRVRVEQHLDGVGHLGLDSKVGLAQEKVDQNVGQRHGPGVDLVGDESAHQARVVVEQGHQHIGAGDPDGRVLVGQGVGDDLEDVVVDEMVVEHGARLELNVLRHGAALLDEQHTVLLPLRVVLVQAKDLKELLDEGDVALQVLDNVDLVEEDERVEHGEGGVVQDPSQDDVLQVLQPIGMVDLPPDRLVLDLNDLLEFGAVAEVVAMVGLVAWEVGVV